MRAGMALTALEAVPGEEIRTPPHTRFVLAGRSPARATTAAPVYAGASPAASGRKGREDRSPTPVGAGRRPQTIIKNIRQIFAHGLAMDYYWIDAEWFGNGPWWNDPGTGV